MQRWAACRAGSGGGRPSRRRSCRRPTSSSWTSPPTTSTCRWLCAGVAGCHLKRHTSAQRFLRAVTLHSSTQQGSTAPSHPLCCSVLAVTRLLAVAGQAIQWAERRLRAPGSSLVLVTHDRAFLEAVSTAVLELDRDGVHLHPFGGRGCYTRFREVRPDIHCWSNTSFDSEMPVAAPAGTCQHPVLHWLAPAASCFADHKCCGLRQPDALLVQRVNGRLARRGGMRQQRRQQTRAQCCARSQSGCPGSPRLGRCPRALWSCAIRVVLGLQRQCDEH